MKTWGPQLSKYLTETINTALNFPVMSWPRQVVPQRVNRGRLAAVSWPRQIVTDPFYGPHSSRDLEGLLRLNLRWQ